MQEKILQLLPYKSSFRFVDNITAVDDNGITGNYTLKPGAFFYEDHFAGNPVTPGVIITEIMAQIGVVSLGIYFLLKDAQSSNEVYPLLTSTEVSFFKMVLPGQKVTVISKKEYFRFNKLKCYIEMYDEGNELVARGMFAGIIKQVDLNVLNNK